METRLIFSSDGTPIAFVENGNIFSMEGMWAGFLRDVNSVFDPNGAYVGLLLEDGRIATDTSKPSSKKVSPPHAPVATHLPLAVPHRPSMPRLPFPFREAVLQGGDVNAARRSFHLYQLILFAAVATAVAALATKLGERFAVSSVVALPENAGSVLISVTSVLLAWFSISLAIPKLRRGSNRILLIGSHSQRTAFRELLLSLLGTEYQITELDIDVPAIDTSDALVKATIERATASLVLFVDHLNSSNGQFNTTPHLVGLKGHDARKVVDLPCIYERLLGQLSPVSASTKQYFIKSQDRPNDVVRSAVQRVFDVCVATLFLFLAFPVMLLTVVLIRLDSRGPIFFRTERVGLHGRIFWLVKFRTMRTDDAHENSVPVWATSFDTRVTRVGRVLRQLRIDELPTILNILWADMSLVGPRPERPLFAKALASELPAYSWRHQVRPGVTGWAQVCTHYGSTIEDEVEKLAYDLYYVKNRSIFLDIVILFETIGVVLTGSKWSATLDR